MKCSVHKLLRWSGKIVMAGLVLPFSALTKAEVTLDGTLGPAGSLAGPNFVIPDTVGQTVGTNLFHSFGLFNINTGESATFTGPAAIDTIISRVTGGSQSFIDGLLRSEIESANFWFINPAGVLFGQHASLDIQGSSHVSTADYLRLGDGGRFDATYPENSVLTTAPPEAFGFLGERQPAGIAVQGSLLQVPAGERLSVVGGDIRIADGTLYAPGGRIDMVSVASPGEVLPNAPDLGVASFERLGRIEISHSSSERPLVDSSLPPEVLGNVIGNVDASGPVGGAVVIRGGQFVVEEASVLAQTSGGNDGEKGAGIDIRVSRLDMHSGDKDQPAFISTDTYGPADGGDIFVEAATMRLSGAGFCETCNDDPTGIFARTDGEGDAGKITAHVGQLNAEAAGALSTVSYSQGEGGDLDVDADNIMLDGEATEFTTLSESAGNAGNIDIKTKGLTLINGAEIRSLTAGPGKGGDISIQAERIFLSGSSLSDPSVHSSITSQQRAIDLIGAGNAGEINVTTRQLEIRDGAHINALTAGEGQGGDMSVTADNILLVGDPSIKFTGLSNETQNDGNAGNLMVTANTLEIRDNARIEASTLYDQETRANLFSGTGGNITVTANDIFISGEGAGIVAKSTNNNPAATSGHIHVIANDSLRLENQGKITVETVLADAGDIDIQVNELLLLRNNSSITTSVAGGKGSGGDIRIDSVFTILDRGSQIAAEALAGHGGDIRIISDFFFKSPDSLVSAASGNPELSGTVVIDAPDTDIIAGFVGLPANFLDAATALTQLCAERSSANVSSLVFRKYEVLPDSPYALRVQLPRAIPAPRTAKQSRAPRTYYVGSPLPPMISCLGNG